MEKIGLFLVVVVLLAVVQETVQQVCSATQCSGKGQLKPCSCGCRNCCIKKFGCGGGFCKSKKCWCFFCKVGGFPKNRRAVDTTKSKPG